MIQSNPTFTPEERSALAKCMKAAANGPFFPDWEFDTLMGVSRDRMRHLATSTELTTDRDWLDAALVAVNNLLGYPHGREAELQEWTGSDLAALGRLRQRFR